MNWGIIGLGKIAKKFASDLMLSETANLYAVASRTQKKANLFADEFSSDVAYDSYEKLLDDPAVDIVYVATPHTLHAELSILAMQSGKHVLCEKPLGINASQVAEVIKVANETGQFMMEGLWSRFNPTIEEVLSRISNGDLGEVNYVYADFSFFSPYDESNRLFNKDTAGGSILDVGIYPVFLAYSVLGLPESMSCTGKLHETGIDMQMAALLDYPSAVVNLMSGLKSTSSMVAEICGLKGSFYINSRWHEADGYTFYDAETKSRTEISLPTVGVGFGPEIEEVEKCISKNNDFYSRRNEKTDRSSLQRRSDLNNIKIIQLTFVYSIYSIDVVLVHIFEPLIYFAHEIIREDILCTRYIFDASTITKDKRLTH